jgi:hypothetical protein
LGIGFSTVLAQTVVSAVPVTRRTSAPAERRQASPAAKFRRGAPNVTQANAGTWLFVVAIAAVVGTVIALLGGSSDHRR